MTRAERLQAIQWRVNTLDGVHPGCICGCQDRRWLLTEIARLEDALRAAKLTKHEQGHGFDGIYPCPTAGGCWCGTDKRNAAINRALDGE